MGPSLTFRYTGRFNWLRLYRECRDFWMHRTSSDTDFNEKKYSHKGSKISIKWEVLVRYDAYYAFKYNVDIKILRPKRIKVVEDGKEIELLEGAMRVWTEFNLIENYKLNSPGGQSTLFQDGWLHQIYRKVTWRDRHDLVDDIGMFTIHDHMDLLKELTSTHAKGYASIWESG